MARDINTKKLKKNAFRYSKVRGETASRIRIPGGVINAKSMAKIAEVAETYGNGTIFVTNRQGVELPGIALEDMPAVNKAIQSIIDDSGVNQEERDKGYPASGTRNVVACPGSRLCPFGCYDTTEFARKMDKMIFPNNLHVKIAFTGCSNDCGKVRMDDFGIIGMTEPPRIAAWAASSASSTATSVPSERCLWSTARSCATLTSASAAASA